VTGFPDRQGLQPERTALAWSRSVLVANGLWLPLLVVQVHLRLWLLAACCAVLAAATAGMTARAPIRHAELRDDRVAARVSPYPRLRRTSWAVAAAAAGTAATAVAVIPAALSR
jgi:hypothetical protein